MGRRLHTTLSPWGAISHLIPLLALGVPLTGCREAVAPLAPTIHGPQLSHTPGHLEGKIAFHSDRDGDVEVFVMNPDGSGVTQLTHNTVNDLIPLWSPGGTRITFGRCTALCDVVVINADGSGETVVTNDGFPGAWSPDGNRIAFGRSDGMFIINADGSGLVRVADPQFVTGWSPDGRQLMLGNNFDGDFEIFALNLDGSGVTRLTDNTANDGGADWSPDGTRIVFSSDRDGGDFDIFVMNADGSGVTQLTDHPARDDGAAWSPDGTRIAFNSDRDGDEEIFVMNADGSGVIQLTFNGVSDGAPHWVQQFSTSNDDFANATVIFTLPFDDVVDITAASSEEGESPPSCAFGSSSRRTVWYSFTPAATGVVSASINAAFSTVVAAYTGSSLGALAQVACRSPFTGSSTFLAEAGRTYHFQVDGMFNQSGLLTFRLEAIPPPPNDDFVNATAIPAPLPFSDVVDITGATSEAGEPPSPCSNPVNRSAWYTFTPTEDTSISASAVNAPFPSVVTAYTGNALASLTPVNCHIFGGKVTFRAEPGTTYYFQVGSFFDQGGRLEFRLEITPPPIAGFGFNPSDPSVFDVVQFVDNSFDPGELPFQSQAWNFGDGTITTTTDCCVPHQYAADGDYAVDHTVTTVDGRTASTSQTVLVRTHDVAITRFSVPQAASAGQTRRIVVGISNARYDETVEVQLYKSAPEGFQLVGSQTQSVPVRPANRTTDFGFSHTFTDDEARLGKITFKAVAVVVTARDALSADNEAIASPTKVNR